MNICLNKNSVFNFTCDRPFLRMWKGTEDKIAGELLVFKIIVVTASGRYTQTDCLTQKGTSYRDWVKVVQFFWFYKNVPHT